MTLKSVMVQLSDEQISELDRVALHRGESRSQVVRDAVDALIAPPIDPDVAALYERAYPDGKSGVDEWGDLDAWHDAARRARADADCADPSIRGDW